MYKKAFKEPSSDNQFQNAIDEEEEFKDKNQTITKKESKKKHTKKKKVKNGVIKEE